MKRRYAMMTGNGGGQNELKQKVEEILNAVARLDVKDAEKIPQLKQLIVRLKEVGVWYKYYYDPYAVMVMPNPEEWVEKVTMRVKAVKPSLKKAKAKAKVKVKAKVKKAAAKRKKR